MIEKGCEEASLWSLRADPLPRLRGPLWISWAPHALFVLLALFLYDSNAVELANAYGFGPVLGSLLAGAQSATLALAMLWPIPAWWLMTVLMVVTARVAETQVAESAAYPWTGQGYVLYAGVLFLLALRVRPRVALAALVISALSGIACANIGLSQAHRSNLEYALPLLATATAIGAALRTSRVAHLRVMAQEVLTAEERAQRTLMQERNRIARELHDVVAHHLSVISIQAQAAPHLVSEPPAPLRNNLASIRENAVAAMTELRRVLGVLRSDNPHDAHPHAPQPTLGQIDQLIGNVRNAGMEVTAEVAGQPRQLAPGIELSAFRIIQEALSNAMRHAPGAQVKVSVSYRSSALEIRVVNGTPKRRAAVQEDIGHGLLGMRERVAMLGGELATGPTPDGGYEVTAILPGDTP